MGTSFNERIIKTNFYLSRRGGGGYEKMDFDTSKFINYEQAALLINPSSSLPIKLGGGEIKKNVNSKENIQNNSTKNIKELEFKPILWCWKKSEKKKEKKQSK